MAVGLRIPCAASSNVRAASAGTAVAAKEAYTGYGFHIVVDHGGGYRTLYAHNARLLAAVGDAVEQGQVIALSGRTGNAADNRLWFELCRDGEYLNPLDYLD